MLGSLLFSFRSWRTAGLATRATPLHGTTPTPHQAPPCLRPFPRRMSAGTEPGMPMVRRQSSSRQVIVGRDDRGRSGEDIKKQRTLSKERAVGEGNFL